MGDATISGLSQNILDRAAGLMFSHVQSISLKNLGVANPFQEASAKAFGYVIHFISFYCRHFKSSVFSKLSCCLMFFPHLSGEGC